MARKVFYSWQSDLPNATNRGFLRQALEAACKVLGEDLDDAQRPQVDSDTQGVPGTPDIAATIFSKIEEAAVFVSDVSIVTRGKGDDGLRPSPNPNVLIELGYAIKALGWNRVIMVMNTAHGGPELLPFDLKTKRVTTYAMSLDIAQRAPERKAVQSVLEKALDSILRQDVSTAETEPRSRAQLAVLAVEEGRPNSTALVRQFVKSLSDRIEDRASKMTGAVPDEELVRALEDTKPLIVEFARVAEAISTHDAREAGQVLFKGFELVLAGCDVKPTFAGRFQDTEFDLMRFAGHEMMVCLAASLVRNERWELLADVLGRDLILKTNKGSVTRRFDALSRRVKSLATREQRLQSNSASLHADMLRERHTSGDLADLVPFDEFMAADYLLFLRGEV
jgi:hypothetical protein